MITDQENQNFDWLKYVKECLDSTEYCCLGTVDNVGNVWTNPVWFAYDEHYNLYFISQLNSRHMKNIKENGKISVSIFSTTPIIAEHVEVRAIQLEGNAVFLKGDELEEPCRYYYSRPKVDPEFNTKYVQSETVKLHQRDATWKFVKITPEHLWLFDTRFFDEERQEVPQNLYK